MQKKTLSGNLRPYYVLPDSVCPISDLIYIPFSSLSQPLTTAHHLPDQEEKVIILWLPLILMSHHFLG